MMAVKVKLRSGGEFRRSKCRSHHQFLNSWPWATGPSHHHINPAKGAPWLRLPRESAKAYDAFCRFRDLRDAQSFTSVGRTLNCTKQNVALWATSWKWRERCLGYDRHLDAMHRAEMIAERRAMKRRQARLAIDLHGICLSQLKELPRRAEARPTRQAECRPNRSVHRGWCGVGVQSSRRRRHAVQENRRSPRGRGRDDNQTSALRTLGIGMLASSREEQLAESRGVQMSAAKRNSNATKVNIEVGTNR